MNNIWPVLRLFDALEDVGKMFSHQFPDTVGLFGVT
jgi:hypothetical protein